MTDLGATRFNGYLIFPSIILAISDVCVSVRVCILKIDWLMDTDQLWLVCVWGNKPLIPAVDKWMNEWVSEWVNKPKRGEGEKAMHVRPTRLAPHDKLWISLFSGVERCETVFVIIMKIIIMMIIIMMVIKREKKNLLQMLHFYHARWYSLIVVPGRWTKEAGVSRASWFGCRDSPCPDRRPSSSKKLMPLVTLSVHFHLSKYVQENCLLLFSCLELLHW